MRKEQVNIRHHYEMFRQLNLWTRARISVAQQQENDELLDASDTRDEINELNAHIEDMDEEIAQLAFQQQETESRVAMLRQMHAERIT